VSLIYLWSLGECTCALLIFCAHAFPKVFASSILSTHLFALLKKWATSFDTLSNGADSGHNSEDRERKGSVNVKTFSNLPATNYQRMRDHSDSQDTELGSLSKQDTDKACIGLEAGLFV
jgi:hypothetical protein